MACIVHVDNSEFFRKQMKSFLAEIGFESESFGKGADALNKIGGGGISYIIMGLSLADMDGEVFIKEATEIAGIVPIIVVTSSDGKERADLLEKLGVKAVIGKSGNWKGELNQILG